LLLLLLVALLPQLLALSLHNAATTSINKRLHRPQRHRGCSTASA
jgi:hypothetical protein